MHLINTASAHEAYVLSPSDFQNGLHQFSAHPFAPLFASEHLGATAIITLFVVASFLLVLFWSATRWSEKLDERIRKIHFGGPFLIRLAISASFFFAALGNAFLGPEIQLSTMPGAWLVRILLLLISAMILLGFFTELAAFIGLGIFVYSFFTYGGYLATYLNYLGELIVLILFGSRFLSVDRVIFKNEHWLKNIEKHRWIEIPLVRITYGLGLIYAGWTIKFLHQGLTVQVVNQYHLQGFFHGTAEFIAAGAGVSEIAIGLFILLGFFQRWTVFISLVFITLSLLYFREMVWPHMMLYGISLSLLINSKDPLTADRYLLPWFKKHVLRRS